MFLLPMDAIELKKHFLQFYLRKKKIPSRLPGSLFRMEKLPATPELSERDQLAINELILM